MSLRLPLLALLLATPAFAQSPAPAPDAALAARVDRLLRATPLIDGHNDWPWALRTGAGDARYRVDLATNARAAGGRAASPPRQTDLPRLRAGRVGAQFWSVYVPATLPGPVAARTTFEQIDLVRDMIRRSGGALQPAFTAEDIVRLHRHGAVASLIGIEGGYAIDNSLPMLREFHRAGVRYMTLTHSKTIDWADSATDAPKHDGLTDFGRAVVAEMNRVGMLVDLSHVSPATMADALDVAKAPVIFSHSSARALVDHPRNVPDAILQRLASNGGVVMVTFVPGFVSAKLFDWYGAEAAEKARLAYRFNGDPARAAAALAGWAKANPQPRATLGDVADHIDHVARVAGHDHVGIGGDYDGVATLPDGLEDVSTYPALFAELARRGWSDANLAKLAGGNLLRAMRAAETYAASQASAPVGDAVIAPSAPAADD